MSEWQLRDNESEKAGSIIPKKKHSKAKNSRAKWRTNEFMKTSDKIRVIHIKQKIRHRRRLFLSLLAVFIIDWKTTD